MEAYPLAGAPFSFQINRNKMRVVIECRLLIEKSNGFVCML